MQEKEKKVEELYNLVKASAKTQTPKGSLFGVKCPKCASKLSKESEKLIVIPGEGGTAFANRVAKDEDLGAGAAYSLTIERFKCKCGYDFAKSIISEMSE